MGTLESDLLNRLASGYTLPPLSLIAVKLVDLASDDRCSTQDLARLIEKDPSLTTRLIQMANNTFFTTAKPVRKISTLLFQKSAGFDAPFLCAKKLFGLDGAVINDILDILLSAFEQVEEVAEALKIEVDTERDLWVLMEKANRALGHISEETSKLSSPPTAEPLPSFETKESLRLEKALSRMAP